MHVYTNEWFIFLKKIDVYTYKWSTQTDTDRHRQTDTQTYTQTHTHRHSQTQTHNTYTHTSCWAETFSAVAWTRHCFWYSRSDVNLREILHSHGLSSIHIVSFVESWLFRISTSLTLPGAVRWLPCFASVCALGLGTARNSQKSAWSSSRIESITGNWLLRISTWIWESAVVCACLCKGLNHNRSVAFVG
jgi:hypothetical protein